MTNEQSHAALKRPKKLIGTWALTSRTLDTYADNSSRWATFDLEISP